MSTVENDRVSWLQGPTAQCSAPPTPSDHPYRIVLLGAPGVGKGTQADLLHQHLGACHLSTGDVFRAAGKLCDCDQSPAMREAREYMRRGELVPDTTVWAMVRERSNCLGCRGGFILDGFPRTLSQAEALKKHLQDANIPIAAVINFELPLDEIVSRLSGRRTCEKCRAVSHIVHQPQRVDGICDNCGGRLFQREDDRPESIKVRMKAYTDSTAPLIEFYRRLGLLISVPAHGTPDEIFKRTIAALNGVATNGAAM